MRETKNDAQTVTPNNTTSPQGDFEQPRGRQHLPEVLEHRRAQGQRLQHIDRPEQNGRPSQHTRARLRSKS